MIFLVHLTDNSITSLSSVAARETRRKINKPHKHNDGWVFIKKRKVVRFDFSDGRPTKNFVGIACLFSLEFRLLYILYGYFCNAIAQLCSHGRGETLKTRLAIARKLMAGSCFNKAEF